MSESSLQAHTNRISALLEERLRIKGRSLAHQVRKLGKRVPRRVRKDAEYLARAQTLTQNPKLARMIDAAEVNRAGSHVTEYLKSVDPHEARKDKILWALAKISALGIAIFIALVWYAWDQGLV